MHVSAQISHPIFLHFLGNFLRFAKSQGHIVSTYATASHLSHPLRQYSIEPHISEDESHQPDALIVWNGIPQETITSQAKTQGIVVWYAENGYFSNTLQLSREGINASAEFADLSRREMLQFEYPTTKAEIPEFACHSIKPDILRYMANKISRPKNLFFSMRTVLRKRRARNFFDSQDEQLDLDKLPPFVFFPLQVNSDTQITHNSPFNHMDDIIPLVVEAARKLGLSVVLKGHPGEVQKWDYAKWHDPNSGVYVTYQSDLDELIARAEVVVVVNSSTGLQSVAQGKSVVMLGDAFYKNAPGLVSTGNCLLEVNNLTRAMQNSRENTPSLSEVQQYIQHLKNNIFIKGNWQKPDGRLYSAMLNRITQQR